MTELSRKILEKYQVRKTYKQKTAFIDLMKAHFPGLSVQEFSFFKCRNLIVGDIDSADIILSAHYDTCARLPFPNFITPKKTAAFYFIRSAAGSCPFGNHSLSQLIDRHIY